MINKPVNLGAVFYPGFELLDMFGPLEMYSLLPVDGVNIFTIAETAGEISSARGMDIGGPRAVAEYDFLSAPDLDIILVPGGFGTFPQLENPAMLKFIADRHSGATYTTSVCTGSAILAAAGILDGRRATTNKQLFSMVTAVSDQVDWVESARWVEDGPVVTSSGVSAGTDMTLAVIAHLWGGDTARGVATAAEHTWNEDADNDPFESELNSLASVLQV